MGKKSGDALALQVLQQANRMLKSDYHVQNGVASPSDAAFRLGVASMLGNVLHCSGNYAGFSYLPSAYENGVLVDESRRCYSLSPRLVKLAGREAAKDFKLARDARALAG